jgi:hypothetical protein
MTNKFIKYEENTDQATKDKGFLGIVTFENKDGDILCYKVQKAKEGNRGFFIVPFSANMNGNWYKAHTIDRNSTSRELDDYLRQCINAQKTTSPYRTEQKSQSYVSTPSPSFQEELPF